jgi:hypothetical protein
MCLDTTPILQSFIAASNKFSRNNPPGKCWRIRLSAGFLGRTAMPRPNLLGSVPVAGRNFATHSMGMLGEGSRMSAVGLRQAPQSSRSSRRIPGDRLPLRTFLSFLQFTCSIKERQKSRRQSPLKPSVCSHPFASYTCGECGAVSPHLSPCSCVAA